ncbi:MAG TPA: hypothetical protein VIV60_34390 [Polyangiaceae bacterium]
MNTACRYQPYSFSQRVQRALLVLALTSRAFERMVHRDDRGTVMAEYAVLLSCVAMGCVVAIVALGAPLVRMFGAQEVWLSLALP